MSATVSTITGCHHPDNERLTVFFSWPFRDDHTETVAAVKDALEERRFSPGGVGQPKGWWTTPEELDRIVVILADTFKKVRLETEDGTLIMGPGGEIMDELDEQPSFFG